MPNHEHFEELSAAVAAGQTSYKSMSAEAWKELTEHWKTCADCREFAGDIAAIFAPTLAELGQKHRALDVPSGATERFLARARSEGTAIKNKQDRHGGNGRKQSGFAFFWAAAVTAIIALLLIVQQVYFQKPVAPAKPRKLGALDLAPSVPSAPDNLTAENTALRAQLRDAESRLTFLASEVAKDKLALKSKNAEQRDEIERLQARNDSLQADLKGHAEEAAKVREDLAALKAAKEADEIASQVEEGELRNLRDSVSQLTAKLRQEEALAATSKDAKELLTARNLHVVDVNDVNENGKKQRPFGRVYYAEGRQLRFYAYDLTDPRKVEANVKFYVWGEKNGVMVKNLGVLHSDSLADNRWRLDFDDAHVLAQIDTVFVTVENQDTVSRPSKKRILDAVLGEKPNHP